jgi:hypothetical protein
MKRGKRRELPCNELARAQLNIADRNALVRHAESHGVPPRFELSVMW